jgi:hypothetical protein
MNSPLYELLKDSIENENPYTDKETLLNQSELFHENGSIEDNEYNDLKILLDVEKVVE